MRIRIHRGTKEIGGTTIGRTGTDEGFATEDDLEREFVRAFKETKGLRFVWTSSQNIDRSVTIFRAAKRPAASS